MKGLSIVFYEHLVPKDTIIKKNIIIIFKLLVISNFITLQLNPLKILKL